MTSRSDGRMAAPVVRRAADDGGVGSRVNVRRGKGVEGRGPDSDEEGG